MPARIVPLQNDYAPSYNFATAYENAVIAETRRATFELILREIQVACPDPIPSWAGAFMCHLLVESLR